MGIFEKLSILSAAAKYDVSCSSSGSNRKNSGGLGNAERMGICHSFADDGRCISLLKVLFSNHCIYDCVYCYNRKSNDIPRASFTVDEIVKLTVEFYQRNYIEGLFLSSGIIKSPDFTMELILQVVKKLRLEQNYQGYIHLKVIPGADQKLIHEAGFYADRISVNIEMPSELSLKELAPDKNRNDIITPMTSIGIKLLENKEDRKKIKKMPQFVPAGQTTQMIIGASPDRDFQIIRLSEGLYKSFGLKRVYYSAYIPVNSNNLKLPAISAPPLLRENRLYQTDWLLRFYGFKSHEILDENHPDLDLDIDPKTSYALRNWSFFPVDIQKADYETLLRVPGIGVLSAQKIISSRRFARLNFEHLKKIGVVLKRAQYFITCSGKPLLQFQDNPFLIRKNLVSSTAKARSQQQYACSLFETEY